MKRENYLPPTSINNVSFRYTNQAIPTTNYHVLSVNYFDDYQFPGAPTSFTTVLNDNSQTVFYNNTTKKPKGLPTGSWIRIMETSTTNPVKADVSFYLYDKKARVVRHRTNNYLTGYTQIDKKLDFIGKVLYTETKHKRLSSSTEILTREDFAYSPQDRLLTHIHKIDSNPSQLLTNNTYDELGQLTSKAVGGTNIFSSTGLQKVDYSYNIRGWLTQINDINNLQKGSDPFDLFAFKINYNTVQGNIAGVDPLYNGNISETFWRTSNDNITRKYGYKYDKLNRLKDAIYLKQGSTANSYGEKIEYDKNGNITLLERYGEMDDDLNKILIDNLTYHYAANSNLLNKVTDLTNNPSGFKDDSTGLNDTIDDYTYDVNGNMTKDDNKGITAIKYNHLNLPTEIIFTGTNKKINYLYNAIGQKVKKTVTNGTNITHTDYLSGYQYQQVGTGTVILQFFPHSEGYVSNTLVSGVNNYNYVFNYTDHLGNIRLSYTKDPSTEGLTILEENHYYPFGLKHNNYNLDQEYFDNESGIIVLKPKTIPYKYKYNGKEWQNELGLNMYDMDMRQYDPAIARWIVQDPVVHYDFSPYNAFDNNPIFFADPSGADSRTFYGEEAQYVVSQLQKRLGGRIQAKSQSNQSDTSSNTNLNITEYTSTNNSGQTFQYKLIDDKKNIHQLSYTETKYSKNRTIKVQSIINNSVNEIVVTDYVTVTRNIQIKVTKNGVEITTEVVTNYGTTSFDFLNCKECYSKSNKQVIDGVDGNQDAKTLSNLISNNLKVNPEFNLFNQPNTILPPLVSAASGYLFSRLGVKRVLPAILLSIDISEGYDYFYKKFNDYSGSSVDVELGKNGTILLSNYNLE